MPRSLMRSLVVSFAALALSLAASACSSCNDDAPKGGGGHDTVAPEDAIRHVHTLEDQALLDRAKRSPDCGFLEAVQCDDPAITATRCELAARAGDRRALLDTLLTDAKSAEPARRGYALRVLANRPDPESVALVEGAIKDPDKTIACPAARYAMHIRHELASRLTELAKTCDELPQLERPDGDPVIAITATRVKEGSGIVRVASLCGE